MSFRDHGVALEHRVDNLEDDVRLRDRTISHLKDRLAHTSETRWRRASVVLGVLAIAAGVVALRTVLRPIAEAAAQTGPVARWEGRTPLHVDTNGDGEAELIGPVSDRDELHWVAAIDGASFALRWRIGPLDPRAVRHLALVDDTTLAIAEGTTLQLVATSDGTVRQRVELPEPVRELCDDPQTDDLWVRGLEQHHLVHPDGSLEASLRPAWCEARAVKRAPGVGGVEASHAVVEGTMVVTLGRDSSNAATLIGSKVGDESARWQHSLHTDQPLEAGRHVVLRGGVAYVGVVRDDTLSVVAIDADTGDLRWKQEAPVRGALRETNVQGDRLTLAVGHRLVVLDVATGDRRALLGR